MALADPQYVDYGSGSVTLPRVISGVNTSTYTSGDGTASLVLSSVYAKRTRRVARLDLNKITADPFIPAQNTKVSMSTYVVFDLPVAGYTATEAKTAFNGLSTLLVGNTDLNLIKLLGGES
jgi:hypothetical protein